MNSNQGITVCFLRTTAVDPEPRINRASNWLGDMVHSIKVLAWDREGRSLAREQIGPVIIERSQMKGRYGGTWRNAFGYVKFNCWILWQLLKHPPDVVHACDLDTLLPALAAAKLRRIRVVYDIFDSYADSRNVGGLKPVIQALDYWAMRQADRIIIAHEKRKQQLGPNRELLKDKIVVIYNTPEDVTIEKTIEHSPYFAYVGVLQPDRGLKELLQAADYNGGGNVIIAGFGPLYNWLTERCCRNSRLQFIGRVSYQQGMALQGNALAIIAMYDPQNLNNRLAAPNKLYEAMCLGRPVITSEGTILAEFVREHSIGFVVPYGDIVELRRVLMFAQENPETLNQMGRRARLLYQKWFSGTVMKERMRSLYRGLFNDDQKRGSSVCIADTNL